MMSNSSLGSTNSNVLTSGADLFTSGFSGPLSADTYRFQLLAFGDSFGLDSYAFRFEVTDLDAPNGPGAIPEPSSALLVGGSLLALVTTRALRGRSSRSSPAS